MFFFYPPWCITVLLSGSAVPAIEKPPKDTVWLHRESVMEIFQEVSPDEILVNYIWTCGYTSVFQCMPCHKIYVQMQSQIWKGVVASDQHTPKDTLRFTSSAALSPLKYQTCRAHSDPIMAVWTDHSLLVYQMFSLLILFTANIWKMTAYWKGRAMARVRAMSQHLILRVSGCSWNVVFSLPSPPEAVQEEDKPAGGEEADEEGGEGVAKWENIVVKQTSSQCCYCVRHHWL